MGINVRHNDIIYVVDLILDLLDTTIYDMRASIVVEQNEKTCYVAELGINIDDG